MTIESITLCNITSLAGEHFIDFSAEPLRSAGLFAITGDTGAGKSSLLDAICLALYGKTPRLEGSFDRISELKAEMTDGANAQLSLHDPRSYLRRGAREGYARVRFSLPGGGRYEANWEVSLTRNNTFKPVERSLDEVSPKGKVTRIAAGVKETNAAVERIVGLDYEQFSRTVILAQGSFANFLKAQSKEKSVLLEKLTGTAVYGRISERIYAMCKEAEAEVECERAKYEGLAQGRLLEEEVEELQHRERMLNAMNTDLQERKERVVHFLEWHTQNSALREAYNQAMQRNSAANNEYLAMRDQEKALLRYDAVVDFRPAFEQINELSHQIEHFKELESATSRRIDELQQQMKDSQLELLQALERKSSAEEQWRLRSSDIAKGHAIEGEIRSLESLQTETEEEQNKAMLDQERAELDLRTRVADEERLKKELEQLSLRRQSLEVHRTMFDNYQTITEKLKQYGAETQQNNRLHHDYTQEVTRHHELSEQFDKVKVATQSLEEKLSSLRASRLGHQQAIAHISETEVYDSYNRDTERGLLLEEARRKWQEISDRYEQIADYRASAQRRMRRIEQKEAEILTAETEEQSRYARHEQLKEAFMLAQAKDVNELRALLKEGTPCPVCGSAHHPYHTEVEQVSGERQQQLEKDFREAEQLYKQQREKLNILREEKRSEQAQQMSEAQVLKALEEKQQDEVNYWQKFSHLDASFVECSPTVNRPARKTTIEMLIDSVERQKKQSEKELKLYRFHSEALKEINEKVERLEEDMEAMAKQHVEIETNLRIHAQNRDRNHQWMVESDARIEALYKSLDDLLTLAGWRDNSLEDYVKRLSEVYEDWRWINESIATKCTQQQVLQSQISALQVAVSELSALTNAKRGKWQKLRETLVEKREELARMFGADTPSGVAEMLQQNIDRATQQHQTLQTEHDQLNKALQQTLGQQHSLVGNRTKTEEELRERRTQLDVAITRFNRDNEPLQQSELERIFRDTRNWNAIRLEINHSKDQVLLARQALEQAEEAYRALQGQPHRPTDEEEHQPEALKMTLATLEQEQQQQQGELELLKHRLRRHEDSIRESEAQHKIVALAEENAEEWKRLNAVFGSHDGKKFRDMAQSYTFSLLVEHANYHLRMLTSRYSLEVIRGSLTLEVIDHDMLDEHRFVNSLSGGETFIVSLALALGLASLSSTTLNIGSLFIDEGFGHLDESSLSMVLDTLAALENGQGRKVGVVSHTEQIRAQIAPQIKVVKQGGSGRSTIVVE